MVETLVERLKYLFSYQLQGKNIKLLVETHKLPQNLLFHSDQSRIEQVLINLIGNSIKFIQSQDGRIKLKLKSSKSHPSFLKFIVSDNGIGIKP